MSRISVISMIAYDYELFLESLPSYIEHVDEVILGLDKSRKTWASKDFSVPEQFFVELSKIDTQKKVKIVEDEFWTLNAVSTEVMTKERHMLSGHVEDGNWILSIDADESIVDIKKFTDFLRTYDDQHALIFGNWITLFKRVGDDYLVIENDYDKIEHFPLATKKKESYTVNRHTAQAVVFSPVCALHNSWARTKKQFEEKIVNQGGYSVQHFQDKWNSLDETNYQTWQNFHPINGPTWQRLRLVKAADLETYAAEKMHEAESELSIRGIASQSRLSLFEGKVISRDANLAAVKEQHSKELSALKADFEAKMVAQVRSYKELKMQLDAELLANKARNTR